MSKKLLILLTTLILFAAACEMRPTVPPTAAPTLTPMPVRLPATDSEVQRVATGDAKAAFDSGSAVIVDVRSPASFKMSHIAGAISIPLADIEANPGGLNLDQDQWIITYCT